MIATPCATCYIRKTDRFEFQGPDPDTAESRGPINGIVNGDGAGSVTRCKNCMFKKVHKIEPDLTTEEFEKRLRPQPGTIGIYIYSPPRQGKPVRKEAPLRAQGKKTGT